MMVKNAVNTLYTALLRALFAEKKIIVSCCYWTHYFHCPT